MTTQLPMIKSTTPQFKLIVPCDVENKIRFLCSQISTIEWSGVLFYKYKGSFEKQDLEIICKDIYVMDIGNSTYTEFSDSIDTAGYIANNPDLLDCQMGLIHSHHSMSTFFSATDIDTLQSEGSSRNNFVSLIVNNAGVYSAAITRKLTFSSPSYQFFGEGNKNGSKNQSTEMIEYFPLTVVIEGKEQTYPDISKRLDEIRENKKPKADSLYAHPNVSSYNVPKSILNSNLNKPSKLPFQTTLFDSPVKEKQFFNETSVLDEKAFKALVCQLITACPIMTNPKLDIKKWVNSSMEPVYNKIFGKASNTLFERWISEYVDFLLSIATKNITADSYDYFSVLNDLALDILSYLDDFKSNPYLDKIKEVLIEYIDDNGSIGPQNKL